MHDRERARAVKQGLGLNLLQRELIQQETPMVGFQRGMDFLSNFPDFLPGMATQGSPRPSSGTASAAAPPVQPTQQVRLPPVQGTSGGSGSVPPAPPAQNGASPASSTASSHRVRLVEVSIDGL
jgi:hypothetical protein